MKQEFEDLEVEWLGMEIHPEFPPEGEPRKPVQPGSRQEAQIEHLKWLAKEAGLDLRQGPVKSNSRLALHAAEYARDAGLFDAFHHRVFKAYFQEGKNIGLKETVLDLARDAGLDVDGLAEALEDGRYSERLASVHEDAQAMWITGVPTFIIGNRFKIEGAQPYDMLREAVLRSRAS